MRADPDGTARLVPCPECGARAGENCKSYPGSGAYADIVHRDRVREAADGDEPMSLACQYGLCGQCPERDEPAEAFDGSYWPIECVCECHIDDDTPDEATG